MLCICMGCILYILPILTIYTKCYVKYFEQYIRTWGLNRRLLPLCERIHYYKYENEEMELYTLSQKFMLNWESCINNVIQLHNSIIIRQDMLLLRKEILDGE